MRLATIRTGGDTRAVRIDGGRAIETGAPDVGALLADGDWRTKAAACSPYASTSIPANAPITPPMRTLRSVSSPW